MAISTRGTGAIGPHIYAPEGPFTGSFAGPTFAYGDVVQGNAGARFIFVKYAPVAAVTYRQGDVFVYDSTFMAVPSKLGAGYHALGSQVGTLFFGGRVGDPATQQGNIWSYLFQPGTYGVWLQINGACAANFTTITAQADLAYTTATLGSVSALAAGAANSETISGMFSAVLSFTFTATDTSGSAVLTAVSDTNKLEVGMVLSGTGIPNGAYITSIDGASVTMSANATSTNAGTTVTAKKGTFWGTTVNGSPIITGVGALLGVYPGATLTGTGVSGTLQSVTGIPGNFVVTMSANATASGTVSIAATQYVEAMLTNPFISAQN